MFDLQGKNKERDLLWNERGKWELKNHVKFLRTKAKHTRPAGKRGATDPACQDVIFQSRSWLAGKLWGVLDPLVDRELACPDSANRKTWGALDPLDHSLIPYLTCGKNMGRASASWP